MNDDQTPKLLTAGQELSPQQKEWMRWLEAEITKRSQAIPAPTRTLLFIVIDELMHISTEEKQNV